jgi:hypothetical protein
MRGKKKHPHKIKEMSLVRKHRRAEQQSVHTLTPHENTGELKLTCPKLHWVPPEKINGDMLEENMPRRRCVALPSMFVCVCVCVFVCVFVCLFVCVVCAVQHTQHTHTHTHTHKTHTHAYMYIHDKKCYVVQSFSLGVIGKFSQGA